MRNSIRNPGKFCCYAATMLVALVMVSSLFRHDRRWGEGFEAKKEKMPCDEVYVVGEGETLQSIMNKCEDPFIVENNPLINGYSDEVFPGLVIRVIPFSDS